MICLATDCRSDREAEKDGDRSMIEIERKEVVVEVGWSRVLRYLCASKAAARFSSRGDDSEVDILQQVFNTLLHFVEELKSLFDDKNGDLAYR